MRCNGLLGGKVLAMLSGAKRMKARGHRTTLHCVKHNQHMLMLGDWGHAPSGKF